MDVSKQQRRRARRFRNSDAFDWASDLKDPERRVRERNLEDKIEMDARFRGIPEVFFELDPEVELPF